MNSVQHLSCKLTFNCLYDVYRRSSSINSKSYDGCASVTISTKRSPSTALTIPDPDCMHLETRLMFHMWVFFGARASREHCILSACIPDFRPMIWLMKATCSQPDAVQAGRDISVSVYTNPDGSRPQYPYAAMLHEHVLSLVNPVTWPLRAI
jgi:hypothetical protein